MLTNPYRTTSKRKEKHLESFPIQTIAKAKEKKRLMSFSRFFGKTVCCANKSKYPVKCGAITNFNTVKIKITDKDPNKRKCPEQVGDKGHRSSHKRKMQNPHSIIL